MPRVRGREGGAGLQLLLPQDLEEELTELPEDRQQAEDPQEAAGRPFLIYGAYGFTGRLLAREAVERGHRPLLAGRSRERLELLARELGLEFAVVGLDDPVALREVVARVDLVIHAAGPFIRTAPPMVGVCLDAGVHYLDITGEVPVFEAIYDLDEGARKAEVVLMPGVGFDVVPTDGLSALLHRRLPGARSLELAILSSGQASAGTLKTILEHLPGGLLVRREGELRSARPGEGGLRREVDFGPGSPGGRRTIMPYTWGDLASAWRSTEIPDITCYMATSRRTARVLPAALPLLQVALAVGPIRRLAQGWVGRVAKGPSPELQERDLTRVWGRVEGPEEEARELVLETMEAYRLTAVAGIRAAEKVLALTRPAASSPLAGALTPSQAFGAEWVLELPDTRLVEVPISREQTPGAAVPPKTPEAPDGKTGAGTRPGILERRGWRIGIGALLLALLLVAVGWERCGLQGCPDPLLLTAYQPGGAPVLLDRHGEEFGHLHPLERRIVPLDSLPEAVAAAFIAVEDQRFHRHRGVDWRRFGLATARTLRPGGRSEGASTITMQLARTVFPDRVSREDRTLRRKLLEIRVSRELERRFTKEEILELYLNHVYFGAGAYGVEAGAYHYFHQPATELTTAQAALLAAVINAPARLDPRRHPDRARERRNLVLTLMEQQGRLPSAEAATARDQALDVAVESPAVRAGTPAPYFVDALRRFLEGEMGEGLYRSGVRIRTTLDPVVQASAEEELARVLEAVEDGGYGPFAGPPFDPSTAVGPEGTEYLQGAVVVLEASTGDVLALVGGRDFAHSRFNRALSARRQMGSAFKPFVYAAALSQGFVASQPLADRAFQVRQAGSPPWSPRNYDGTFRESVSLREALVESLNVPTARLAMAVGMEEVARTARAVGIRDSVPGTPAAALGTVNASPLELAEAYTSFARLGGPAASRFVRSVNHEDGTVLLDEGRGRDEGERGEGLDPRVAYLVTSMLNDVVDRGTGAGVRAAGFQRPAAGKTGTTQNAHDAWFVGYTPDLVAAVWIGFDRPTPILPGATGGRLAAPVWGRLMARVYTERDGLSGWNRPGGLMERRVDLGTGQVLRDGCEPAGGGAARELFLAEHLPASSCPRERNLLSRLLSFILGEEDPSPRGSPGRPGPSGSSPQEGPELLDPADAVERLLGAPRVELTPSGIR